MPMSLRNFCGHWQTTAGSNHELCRRKTSPAVALKSRGDVERHFEHGRTCTCRHVLVKARPHVTRGPDVRACAATAPEQQTDVDSAAKLHSYFQWLLANGIQGFGSQSDPIALCVDEESGERGVAAIQDIPSGERLVAIPLRLAISDWQEDPDAEAYGLQGTPWFVRLATKLLREQAKGPDSQWAPYIGILPAEVPQLEEVDVQTAEHPPLAVARQEQLIERSEWYQRLSPEARGGASEQQFAWAVSVVQSRALGTAARGGGAGIGVRMLLPLLDFFNHGGDEQAGAHLPSISLQNVRWDLQRPADGEEAVGGKWLLHVMTTKDVEAGEELFLDYGRHDNDDFLLHYGFAVAGNPHDSVALFSDTAAAVAWLLDRGGQAEASDSTFLEALKVATEAADEAEDEMLTRVETAPAGPDLMLHRDCRVDPRLLAAFRTLAGEQAEVSIALRCEEMLSRCTPLLQDVETLAADKSDDNHMYFASLLQKYSRDIEQMRRLADFARPTAPGTSRSHEEWAAHVALLSGLGGGRPNETGRLPASSPRMAATLLKYRVNKKTLLWEVLLAAAAAAAEAGPAERTAV